MTEKFRLKVGFIVPKEHGKPTFRYVEKWIEQNEHVGWLVDQGEVVHQETIIKGDTFEIVTLFHIEINPTQMMYYSLKYSEKCKSNTNIVYLDLHGL